MRIGTWNLEGRWDDRHRQFLLGQECDIWLLTEVRHDVELNGFAQVRTGTNMAPGRSWASVATADEGEALDEPHPATAAARVGDMTLWSSILPWRACGARPPWSGSAHAEKMRNAADHLVRSRPEGTVIWGGDWNQSLRGADAVGSAGGRTALLDAAFALDLKVPTTDLPHRLPGLMSIDHIAVPSDWGVSHSNRVVAMAGGHRLSDHDAYVIETA